METQQSSNHRTSPTQIIKQRRAGSSSMCYISHNTQVNITIIIIIIIINTIIIIINITYYIIININIQVHGGHPRQALQAGY